MEITKKQLLAVMPNAGKVADSYLPLLAKYSEKYGITTKMRMAHFLAQIAHESCELRVVQENLKYSAKGLRKTWPTRFKTDTIAVQYAYKPIAIANKVYAERLGNGNEASGDGWRYRGRGLIQITGKSNYKLCGDGCGLKLTENPDLLLGADAAMQSAMWFWNRNGLNKLADADNITAITRKINGGVNGLESRRTFLKRAKVALEI